MSRHHSLRSIIITCRYYRTEGQVTEIGHPIARSGITQDQVNAAGDALLVVDALPTIEHVWQPSELARQTRRTGCSMSG